MPALCSVKNATRGEKCVGPHCCLPRPATVVKIGPAVSPAATTLTEALGTALGSSSAAADPDVALMLEVAGGSEAAFTTLVRRHQQSLLNFFARMGAHTDGEDLVQETFVRLFRYRASYRPAARFTTFLYHLARHVWADRGRKIMRLERVAAAWENEQHARGAETSDAPSGKSLDVQGALDRLSPKLREVIVLNVYQGLRYQEVADVLGIPLGTVKSRINLALTALKDALR